MTKKVLIVEDDTFISDMYSHSLAKAGYAVKSVVSGDRGLAEAISGGYDLIFLDLMIPDKLGIDVLKELREAIDRAGTVQPRVVISTNYDEDEETREQLNELADGYIIKAETTPSDIVDITKKVIEPTG